jgi:diacylglycerol O-acyltransferase
MGYERLPRVGQFFLTPGVTSDDRHGCLVLLLAPDAEGRVPNRDAIVALVRARIHLVPPRFRRVLAWPPCRLAGPLLVDDPTFDANTRVRALGAGAALSWDGFRAILTAYVATPLDQMEPLWEIALVPNLPDGRVALLVKLHHAIVEGEGALASLGALLFARSPNIDPGIAVPWQAAPSPNAGRHAVLALKDQARRAAASLRQAGAAVLAWRHPSQKWEQLREVAIAYRTQLAGRRPPSPLNQLVGANDVAVAVGDDATIQAIRNGFNGEVSFDDVIMAAVAGGLRHWFIHRGLPALDQITQIPVSLARRGLGVSQIFADMPSFMVIRLPVSEADAATRLRLICRMSAERLPQAAALQRLIQPLGHLPMPLYKSWAGRLYNKAAHFHLASLRGPPIPLHVLNNKLELAYIVTPVRGDLALRLAVLALGGKVTISLACDPAIIREPDYLARSIEAAIAELTVGRT